MAYSFERPVGAAADAKELEYIAALHQTQDAEEDDWMNASIETTDVKNFLLSRYGIKVTKDEVREQIFAEMGGGDGADECIDLTEVVAILLIPFFAKLSNNDNNEEVQQNEMHAHQTFEFDAFHSKLEKDAYMRAKSVHYMTAEHKTIISDVLKTILRDAAAKTESESPLRSSSSSQPLTRDLLRQIFTYYGERDLVQDETFIDQMIEAASGGDPNPQLNAETFLRGMNHDIKLYDVLNESKFQTHFEDVFGIDSYIKKHPAFEHVNLEKEEEDLEHNASDLSLPKGKPSTIERIFTFPQIDFLADTFRSRAHYIFVWIAVGWIFFVFGHRGFNAGFNICNDEDMEGFGCKVAQSILDWMGLMVATIFLVAPCVMVLSLGNNVYNNSIYEIMGGIVGTIVIVFLPAINDQTRLPKDESVVDVYKMFAVICFIIGSVLLLIQASNLIRFCVPDSRLTQSQLLTALLRGSSVRSEFGIKQASIIKVHQMVKNAYDLHGHKVDENQVNSQDALLNFTKVTEVKESSGGFIWAWKLFLSRELSDKEGVWLHTRLLTGNIAQLLITMSGAIMVYLYSNPPIIAFFSNLNSIENMNRSSSCFSTFNPESCYFPKTGGVYTGLAVCPSISFYDESCANNFITAGGKFYDEACSALESAVDQLPSPYNYMYTGECPSLYIPYPDDMFSETIESTEELYCAGRLSACTAATKNDDGSIEMGICVLGTSAFQPIPYQFGGNLCSNYTQMEGLMEDKAVFQAYIPRKWMFDRSLKVGVICMALVGIINAASTIPSMIVTTIKFRTGVIPSLRDPYFKKYRVGLMKTTGLLGASLWGTLFSSIIIFLLAAGLTFLAVYPITNPYIVSSIVPALIGFIVTLLLKIVIQIFLNKYNFVAFYRKRPLFANISHLCFECWHLAITWTYILVRCVKLTLVTIAYMGRFDTPILNRGVGEIGPLKLDPYPFIFQQDLLAIDSHRHPYIERLGMMYLMKLNHRENFAKKTGSIWRLLFVFALFPWLRKYRVLSDEFLESNLLEEIEKTSGKVVSSAVQAKIAALSAQVHQLTKEKEELAVGTWEGNVDKALPILGTTDGSMKGSPDGVILGEPISENVGDVDSEGSEEGALFIVGTAEGSTEGNVEGATPGEPVDTCEATVDGALLTVGATDDSTEGIVLGEPVKRD